MSAHLHQKLRGRWLESVALICRDPVFRRDRNGTDLKTQAMARLHDHKHEAEQDLNIHKHETEQDLNIHKDAHDS